MSEFFRLRVRRDRLIAALVVAACVGISAGVARAARVRGVLENLKVEVTGKLLGFTRTRVAPPADAVAVRDRPVALFLAVLDGESLPIPAPSEHQIVTVDGLRFTPNIASCASDAQVSFVNADRDPVTVVVDGKELGTIEPGAQKTYVCSPGSAERVVRVVEWPHMRAMVYVGAVGVAGAADERGRFSIEAPRGKYELRVVTTEGVIITRTVDIENRDIDLGGLDLAQGAAGAAPSE